MRTIWIAAVLAACAILPASAVTPYVPNGTCDGWPRAPIGMAPGYCAGIVVAPPADYNARTIRRPRVILPLPGGKDFLVSDMGAFDSPGGKIFRITAERGKPTVIKPIITGLYMPHYMTWRPDHKVYANEQGRVFRFDPLAADPAATIETVIPNAPDTRTHYNFHPLSSFMFDTNDDMLLSVGAPSDQCFVGKPANKDGPPDGTTHCNQSEGDYKGAGIRRYRYLGDNKWSPDFTMMAQGLRNSVAMVRHSSGTLMEADNGVDFPPATTPFEELNVLKQGAHYGWPYCYDMHGVNPIWGPLHVLDCSGATGPYTPPVRLLPPHGAPLSMLYYDGAMFPELRGKLILSLHGYRVAGARLVAFTVDDKGIPVLTPNAHYDAYTGAHGDQTVSIPYGGPASEPLVLTPGWNDVAGSHPMGAPLGLAVGDDGAIWVAEDRNATILRIARDRP